MVDAKAFPSSKPILEKLGIKPSHRAGVLELPEQGFRILGTLPAGVAFESILKGEFDFLIGFYSTEKDLKAALTLAKKLLKNAGMIWVCWQKGNITELNRDLIAKISEVKGLETVSAVSMNDVWSGLKLMYPKNMRSN